MNYPGLTGKKVQPQQDGLFAGSRLPSSMASTGSRFPMVLSDLLFAGFLLLFLTQTAFAFWLERINLRHLELFGKEVPASLEGVVDSSKLPRIFEYTTARSRLNSSRELVSDAILLGMILFGVFPAIESTFTGWGLTGVQAGVLFFLLPGAVLYLAGLPFDYYGSFVVEERFGFNRATVGLWVADHVKSALISLLLLIIVLSLLLWTIEWAPHSWWFWGFLIVSVLQIVVAVLYPVVIAPLFNRFEPVRDELLSKKIKTLMESNGIEVKHILQMNAGLRSRHTNAYFTGMGKTKRVVLYDTLLESHNHQEILSVLAHELGHMKKRHVFKQILLFQMLMAGGFYLTWLLVQWPVLYRAFGFESVRPYAGLFIAAIFWEKAGFFLRPFQMAVSRRFERQADLFALKIVGSPASMIAALRRLADDNLANLAPHPLYVWFHYSHPPLLERMSLLDGTKGESRMTSTSSIDRRKSQSC